jgi:hypothetical protein
MNAHLRIAETGPSDARLYSAPVSSKPSRQDHDGYKVVIQRARRGAAT